MNYKKQAFILLSCLFLCQESALQAVCSRGIRSAMAKIWQNHNNGQLGNSVVQRLIDPTKKMPANFDYVTLYSGSISKMVFLAMIMRGKKSIDMCMYHLKDAEIIAALCNAASRGVKVEVIVDKSSFDHKYRSLNYLTKEASDNLKVLVFDGRTTAQMHVKGALFGGKYLLFGSANASETAAKHNVEFMRLQKEKSCDVEKWLEYMRVISKVIRKQKAQHAFEKQATINEMLRIGAMQNK